MKLKVTKTNMYQLCKTLVPDMPPMKNVYFNKSSKACWWMGFYTQQDHTEHNIHLTPCISKATLRDEWYIKEKEHLWKEMYYPRPKEHITHNITIDQLRSFNMIQE